ncbi:MAG: SIMPL domain-containing protein [Acidobacteriota bacterium]
MNRVIAAVMIGGALLVVGSFAQEKTDRRTIEVTGSAERLITPDIFTFKITLSERLENKQKITIEQQESSLRRELTQAGIDVSKDLTVFDLSSTYIRQKRMKDTLATKDYRLKLTDPAKITMLQDIADRLNITKLDLIDTDISDIVRHRREVKIEAIQAAKAKADYLLTAIGEKVGKPVLIVEGEDASSLPIDGRGLSNVYSANVSAGSFGGGGGGSDALSFSQIKIRYAVVAKFEIQ